MEECPGWCSRRRAAEGQAGFCQAGGTGRGLGDGKEGEIAIRTAQRVPWGRREVQWFTIPDGSHNWGREQSNDGGPENTTEVPYGVPTSRGTRWKRREILDPIAGRWGR